MARTLPVLAALALAAVAALELRAGRRGIVETGVVPWGKKRVRRRQSSDCCDALSDDWRHNRDIYRRWRPPSPVSYREAQQEVWNESVAAAKSGDYSKPASRRAVLGRMHQYKLGSWLACRRQCRGEREYNEPTVFKDDDGFAVWYRGEGYEIRPTRGGAAVVNGDGFEVDWFESTYEAIDDARERLLEELADPVIPEGDDVPF